MRSAVYVVSIVDSGVYFHPVDDLFAIVVGHDTEFLLDIVCLAVDKFLIGLANTGQVVAVNALEILA